MLHLIANCYKQSSDCSSLRFSHKDNLHKMIEPIRAWPHHHVGLMGDHPEPHLVELLHQLQQIYVLPVSKFDMLETSEGLLPRI